MGCYGGHKVTLMTDSTHSNSIVTEHDLDVLDGTAAGLAPADAAVPANAARPASLLVAFVCIALLALNVWLITMAHTHEVRQLTLANEKLAGSIAQQVDGSLLDVQHILDDTVFELEQSELAPKVLEKLQPIFVNRVARVDQLKGLFVYDAKGRWLLTSEPTSDESRNNADREYFKFHRDNPSREAYLGLPILSRSTGDWVIPLSRRLNDPDGKFDGVALATIQLSYFKQILSRFKLGQQGATAIALNGHILVRVPFQESDIGRDLSNQPILQRAARQPSGSSEERSLIDHVVRIISFDHASNFPIIAVVAVGQDEVMHDWLSASIVQTSVVLVMCALVIAGGRILLRAVRRREHAEGRLRLTRDALAHANEQLGHLARDDGLTGIPNRRFFDMRLTRLFGHAQRNKQALAVVMVDVDNFKNFNDRYGHVAGDECLRRLAKAVRSAVQRPEDLVARYGGEELALLLPDTDSEGARHVAEKARMAVLELQIPHAGSKSGFVTISLGVGVMSPTPEDSSQTLVTVADRALYQAKERGRNQVV